MKAISLHQPFATLIAIEAKLFETRSWPTKHRGWIAIHAAQRWTSEQSYMTKTPHFAKALKGQNLPLGEIVCVAFVRGCYTSTYVLDTLKTQKDLAQIAFGDYTPGRYAWALDRIIKLPQPIRCRGRQGLFEANIEAQLPDRVLALINTGK